MPQIASGEWRIVLSPSLFAIRHSPIRKLLFNGLRVDRRAGAAGDDQRRAPEEELVGPVPGAALRRLLEKEDPARAQAHGRDPPPVPGLVRLGGLFGPPLDAPGVGADRRDLFVLAPVAFLKLDAGRVAAGVPAP